MDLCSLVNNCFGTRFKEFSDIKWKYIYDTYGKELFFDFLSEFKKEILSMTGVKLFNTQTALTEVFISRKFEEPEAIRFSEFFDWTWYTAQVKNLSEALEKYPNYLDWDVILWRAEELSEEQIYKYIDKIPIKRCITRTGRKFSEDFIEKYLWCIVGYDVRVEILRQRRYPKEFRDRLRSRLYEGL